MDKHEVIAWKWGVLAALPVMIFALLPQIHLWAARGSDYQGSYAHLDPDEVVYSAYVKALIDGRSRRNDPYTGRDDAPGAPQPETYFSIQFIPAYLVAVPARLLGVSASTAFVAVLLLVAFASSLAIFWLLSIVTGNNRLATVGVWVVLFFGTAAAENITALFQTGGAGYGFFPALRRYLPAVPFPLFFIFLIFVWRAFASGANRSLLWAFAAGVILALLIFSYFYFWTAAAAWLASLAVLWIFMRPPGWQRMISSIGIIAVIATIALVPYFLMISRRAETIDQTQALTATRAPDLFRAPEVCGAIILLLLVHYVRRGRINRTDHAALFAASLALMPFVVFNQQVISGYSLQSFHYEEFIANYLVLVAVVILLALVKREMPKRVHLWIAGGALALGLMSGVGATRINAEDNLLSDEAVPVFLRLAETERRDKYGGAAFVANPWLADVMPTVAPHPLLWAPRLYVFAGVSTTENRERFYQYLYYSGFDEIQFARALERNYTARAAIFGLDRVNPMLTLHPKPITPEEIQEETRRYGEYIAKFDRERAAHPNLSYVIVEDAQNLSNLDRWYERETGERVGNLTLYRVRLRP